MWRNKRMDIMRDVSDCVDRAWEFPEDTMYILVWCKSGKHRSVALAVFITLVLEDRLGGER